MQKKVKNRRTTAKRKKTAQELEDARDVAYMKRHAKDKTYPFDVVARQLGFHDLADSYLSQGAILDA